ncbi:D-glycero-beta-D-manno-heptose 1,7-bisphosphate 7-phosphatase [Lentibacillus halophilus]|uniref:D,D-heptose 1,7-bisphosphate phosphatase n=1 Tax=Lentibacillus halophilus TaxID=295065 RepID=A0ABN0Z7I6_9BACI
MNQAVFLDRDGVINEVLTDRVKFVNRPSDVYLLDGVGEAIQAFNDMGFFVFVVTNQGGIGLGYMTDDALDAVHKRMQADLAAFGATIDDIAYCPHKPHAGCECRKPRPKMIVDLAQTYDIALDKSFMVGDRDPDIAAGNKAGTTTVFIGHRERQQHEVTADKTFPDLLAFARWLQKQ